MKSVMETKEILNYLPHRYPFLLIDRVIEIEPSQSIIALKNISVNEAFFAGHFPQQPVMPGVLILEAMAQAAAILFYKSTHLHPDEWLLFFAGIDHARFRRIVIPGDQLRLEIKVLRRRQELWKLAGVTYVDGEEACSAELLSAMRKTDGREGE